MSVKQALKAHEVAARTWRFVGRRGEGGCSYLFRRGYGIAAESRIIDEADFWGGEWGRLIRMARAVVW